MKRGLALTFALACAVGCGSSSKSSSSGAGSTTSGSGSGSGTSSSGATTGTQGGTIAGGSTSAGTASSSSGGSSTGTSGSCASGACTYDNDCGGSRTCLNGCCVATADTCNSGSCAYGPCAPGWTCDTTTDCCVGGTTGGGSCQFDGGIITNGVCNPDCPQGFHCQSGTCVLNGGEGPIQVTLRYNNFDDLDLHVVEPGGCEVYYSNPQCVGSLDLDSNAGCGQSTVDAENIIYPPLDGGVPPPSGTYTVRVDMYQNCDGAAHIPFEVIVRHNGTTDTYCMGFDDPDGGAYPGDNGQAGSGVFVTTFTYP